MSYRTNLPGSPLLITIIPYCNGLESPSNRHYISFKLNIPFISWALSRSLIRKGCDTASISIMENFPSSSAAGKIVLPYWYQNRISTWSMNRLRAISPSSRPRFRTTHLQQYMAYDTLLLTRRLSSSINTFATLVASFAYWNSFNPSDATEKILFRVKSVPRFSSVAMLLVVV